MVKSVEMATVTVDTHSLDLRVEPTVEEVDKKRQTYLDKLQQYTLSRYEEANKLISKNRSGVSL